MHFQDHLSCDCSIIVNVKLHESVGDICGSWWGKKVPNVTDVCGVYL